MTPRSVRNFNNAANDYFDSQGSHNTNAAHMKAEVPGAFRRNATSAVAAYIYRLGIREGWMSVDTPDAGVVLRTEDGHSETFPRDATLNVWQSVAEQLSTEVSLVQIFGKTRGLIVLITQLTIICKSILVDMVLQCWEGQSMVPIDDMQQQAYVLEDIHMLDRVPSSSGMFFIRDSSALVLYGNALHGLDLAKQIEAILTHACSAAVSPTNMSDFSSPSISYKQKDLDSQQLQWAATLDKEPEQEPEREHEVAPVVLLNPETDEPVIEEGRTTNHTSAILTGLAISLNCFLMVLFAREDLQLYLEAKSLTRLALLAVIPARYFVSQYFCENIVLVLAQIVFPIAQMHKNSLFYSGKRSKILPVEHVLPHFTVQIPVYRESLRETIAPSIASVIEAAERYRAEGGTVNILVSEDGLRLCNEKDARERLEYYAAHDCAWVARPAQGDNGYIREGRFKKASK